MEISSHLTPGCFNLASIASSSCLNCFNWICSIADHLWLEGAQAVEDAGFNELPLFSNDVPRGIGVVDYLSAAQSRTVFGLTHSLWFHAIASLILVSIRHLS